MSNAQPTNAITTVKPLSIIQGANPLKFSPDAQKLMLVRDQKGNWTVEEVATIGESDLLVIRNEAGTLKAFKKTVRLFEEKKEIAKVSRNWIVTVQGYNKLNQVTGLHEITPPSIQVDGKEQSNPYVQYDAKGEIKKVIVRKMVIGYSVVGNLVATDVVRHYNFDAYYMQDLQKKAEYKPESAKFATELSCPFAPEETVQYKGDVPYVKTPKGKIYIFKRVKDIEGIWIDPAHDEIRSVYDQHVQHQKFGDVIAQNVASRNAKKAHPAIAATNVIAYGEENKRHADVTVFGYRSTISKDEAENISKKILRGEQVDGVEISHSVEDASFEEVELETGHVVDEAAATEGNNKPAQSEEPKPATPSPAQQQEKKPEPTGEKSLTQQIEEIAKKKSLDIQKMCDNLFEAPYHTLDDAQLTKLLGVMKGVQGGAKAK